MHRLQQSLLIIVFSLLLVHTLVYLAFGIALIPFPFDYDQAEGFELNNAVLLASGQCPYCNNDTFPFYGSGYPPLFHLLMAPFVKLFGPQFWYGRLIIFGATFVTAGAIAWAVHKEGGRTLIAVIAGFAYLSSNYIYHIGPLLRQHLLMVMFETLAVVIIADAFKTDESKRKRRLAIALLMLLCGGYTKQLVYATCIAVALWLLLQNPRIALRFNIALLTLVGIIFAILMLATDNQWWTNIIAANQNPYDLHQFVGLLFQFFRLHGWLLALAAILIVYELYFERLSVYAIWCIVALANTTAAGKWGAGDSYFATALAAICILSGIFLARSTTGKWSPNDNYLAKILRRPRLSIGREWIGLAAAFAFLAYGVTVFKMPTSGAIFGPLAEAFNIRPLPSWRYPLYDPAGWTLGYAVTGHLPSPDDYDSGWQIVNEIRGTSGLLLSEDAGFNFRSQREVIGNAVQLKNLWENGLYDPAELISYIESHRFGLVILRAALFPQPVLNAIGEHYELDNVITMNGFDYQLWRPKTSADGASAQD